MPEIVLTEFFGIDEGYRHSLIFQHMLEHYCRIEPTGTEFNRFVSKELSLFGGTYRFRGSKQIAVFDNDCDLTQVVMVWL